jgi:hypothetical protein
MSHIKECLGCGQTADHNVSKYCSRQCELASDEVNNFGKTIMEFRSDDTRIFFYDFAFGDLCDLWTTYLLRRVRAKDLAKARQVDRALERLEKAILTKLNRYVPVPNCQTRREIDALLHTLLYANARIWDWKDAHWNENCVEVDDWLDYQGFYRLRDNARQQLDKMVEHSTMTEKTYDQ